MNLCRELALPLQINDLCGMLRKRITRTDACDVLLTISEKGKASEPKVAHCNRPELEKPAVESLLKSDYKPGMVNGKAVPMRGSIHLNYGDAPATPSEAPK